MKNKYLVITLCLLVLLTGCSNGKGTKKNDENAGSASTQNVQKHGTEKKVDKKENDEDDGAVTDRTGYFELTDGGRTIDGLTEEGKKQTVLVIPKGVTSLGYLGTDLNWAKAEEIRFESDDDINIEDTFRGCENLKKIVFPAKISEIPDYSFDMCENLESITIPADVTRIGEWAFNGCHNLKEITFEGNKCTSIGAYALSDTGLESITLPEGLEIIEEDTFSIAENLKSVTFPSTIKRIDDTAFATTSITEIHFPSEVEDITFGISPFGGNALDITVYIVEGSWMDLNRDKWNIGLISKTNGFKAIEYEN